MAYVRDKFWIFGVRAHQDDIWLKPPPGIKVPYKFRSRITPSEAAFMLHARNVLMINCEGEPAPYGEDAYGYMESFCRMNKVLWGGTGSDGFRAGNEEEFICDLCEKYPNIAGEYLDDFAGRYRKYPDKVERAMAFLKEIRSKLDKAPKPMELYTTWYWDEEPFPGMEEYIDAFVFFCHHIDEINALKDNFEKIEKLYPNKKKLLGIYMYSFHDRRPTPVELMEKQCNLALELLREGRLDGLIFEANSVMGVGLESEMWLRDWVEKVQDIEVPD